jgi:hypothetical protein
MSVCSVTIWQVVPHSLHGCWWGEHITGRADGIRSGSAWRCEVFIIRAEFTIPTVVPPTDTRWKLVIRAFLVDGILSFCTVYYNLASRLTFCTFKFRTVVFGLESTTCGDLKI